MAMIGNTQENVETPDFIWEEEDEVEQLKLIEVGTNF